MAHLSTYFFLDDVTGTHDVKKLKRELDTLPGVTSVSISDSGCLAVDYDSTGVRQEQIRQKVLDLAIRSGRLNRKAAPQGAVFFILPLPGVRGGTPLLPPSSPTGRRRAPSAGKRTAPLRPPGTPPEG